MALLVCRYVLQRWLPNRHCVRRGRLRRREDTRTDFWSDCQRHHLRAIYCVQS
jgi:hypothetical protein